MNLPADAPPSRAVASCTRHPEEAFSGFCPSCLFDRLSLLDQSPPATSSSSSRKPPSLRSLFKPFPELRRSKSFSADAPASRAALEPQRHSCDVRTQNDQIRLDDVVESVVEEAKPMRDLMDELDHRKASSSSSIVGSFWTAASVLSKKLQKWRRNQKPKTIRNGVVSSETALPVEKPIRRQLRDTQSEIADYGFGRRSCDTDPRFSLDDRRIAFDDDRRISLDEPRASWDGHLIGRSSFPKIRTEEPVPATGSTGDPGGSAQTREYYDSSRRRRSFDRSGSFRKAVIGDENKPSTAKVSPATSTVDYKLQIPDSISNLNPNCSGNFGKMAFRDHNAGFTGVRRGSMKKSSSRRWGRGWSIWGFMNRRGGGGEEEEEDGVGVVQRSLSESWRGGGGGGERKVCRSNSSVSFRSSNMNSLERNRSGRWESRGNVEGGMLRFYLTPLRGSSRRNGSGRTGQAQSIARSVLRLY